MILENQGLDQEDLPKSLEKILLWMKDSTKAEEFLHRSQDLDHLQGIEILEKWTALESRILVQL
jgi:hypothetical protein